MNEVGPSSENRDRGYLRLYRSQFDADDALWKRSRLKSEWEAWQLLLSLAQYRDEPGEVVVNGEVVTVHRGELVIGQRELAARLGWGRQRVRTFMKLLQNLARLQPTGQPKVGHYKVSNYGFYNFGQAESNPGSNPRSNPRLTQGQPKVNPIQEGKEGKKAPDHAADRPPRSAPDPRIKAFLDWYGGQYAAQFKVPYVAAFGADGKALKGILAALERAGIEADLPDTLKAAGQRFLEDDWPRQYGGHTIRNFCAQINRYLVGDSDKGKKGNEWPPSTVRL
jgi:hypothetical protein